MFSPVDPNLPVLRFPRDADYWRQFKLGTTHQFELRKGGLGFYQVNMQPVHAPVSTVVMQTTLANIDSVMIAGTWRKRSGQLLEDVPEAGTGGDVRSPADPVPVDKGAVLGPVQSRDRAGAARKRVHRKEPLQGLDVRE